MCDILSSFLPSSLLLTIPDCLYVCPNVQHEQFLKDGSRAGFLIGDGAGEACNPTENSVTTRSFS